MNCHELQPYLDAYRTGETSTALRETITGHLRGCPECRKELAMMQQLTDTAARLGVTAPAVILTRVRAGTGDRYGAVETEFGRVWIGFTDDGISMLQLNLPDDSAFETCYAHRLGRPVWPGTTPERYVAAVRKALEGAKTTRVPVVLKGLSDFEQAVLRHLTQIPQGEVRPYAWLAKEAGRPRAVRAVGTIMARNPVPFLLPCHRVVPSGGGVGNYGFGPEMKRTLLEREGVSLNHLEALERQRVRFTGSRTTGIFCYPTCRDARRISWENQVTFSGAKEAEAKGYRPCRHCRPLT